MNSNSTSAERPDADRLVAQTARRIRVACGREPGDVLLAGGHVVNVFTSRIERADVVIADEWIAGVGRCPWRAREHVDAQGCLILPGLIDAHMHLESTMLMPAELTRLVAPCGTAAIVADPHEVANVLGVAGVELLLAASRQLPVDIFFMAPSCVPATGWDDAGAELDAAAVAQLLQKPQVLGLAEVMDLPAVLGARLSMMDKIVAARRRRLPVDGHAPAVRGRDLVAYVAAGIRSDHESTTPEEAAEKASLGMMVQVREGTGAKNLDALMPLLVQDRLGDWSLATDDIQPNDLLARGHINHLVQRLVQAGVPLARALRHAALVPARHYGLLDRGAVAPGYKADLIVVRGDPEVPDQLDLRPELVFHSGQLVARDGVMLSQEPGEHVTADNTIHVAPVGPSDFQLSVSGSTALVIEVLPDQIITRRQRRSVTTVDGQWAFDPQDDVVLVASVERHRATGRIGLGLATGFGLRHGALGSSVAHDAHNLILAGTNARDLVVCVRALRDSGGGWVVVADGQVLARLPLPIAGLISQSDAATVCQQMEEVAAAARSLGCRLPEPFATLSFLALPVIPQLRVTDRGLFDVAQQRFVAAGC